MRAKFSECRKCIYYQDRLEARGEEPSPCDECSCGEQFEEADVGLDFEERRS